VRLLLVGGFVLAIGVGLTVLYFSLATFFAVHAKALDGHRKAAQKMATRAQMTQPPQKIETEKLEASQKGEIQATAKAGK